MKTIKIEIMKAMRRYPTVGAIITTEVDHAGIIKDNFMRRRVLDSERDGCVRIVEDKKPVKTAKDKISTTEGQTNDG